MSPHLSQDYSTMSSTNTIESLTKEILSNNYGMYSKKGNYAIGDALLHYLMNETDYDPETVAENVPDYIGNPDDYKSFPKDSKYSNNFDEASDTTVRECIYEAYEQYRPLFHQAIASNYSDKDIAKAIQDTCNTLAWTYTSDINDLVTEFNKWFPTADNKYTHTYNKNINQYVIKHTPKVVQSWIEKVSMEFHQQRQHHIYYKEIISYCTKYGFTYNPLMNTYFIQWLEHPDNTSYSYKVTHKKCVHIWFSTLKKTVTL